MLIGFRFTKNKRKREITVEKLFGGLINPEGTEKLFPSMSQLSFPALQKTYLLK